MNVQPKGVIVPMITPFNEEGDLDEDALRELTDYLIGTGVHALFPAGSTGEGWALTRVERKRIFEVVVEQASGRLPIYGGTGAISTREAVYLTQLAENCGVDAVIVITPFYLAPSDEELFQHYAALARATKLPVIPYNNPSRTGGVNLTADLIAQLSKIDNVTGVKDSSGNLALTTQFVERTPPEFAVCQGRDDLVFPSLLIGCPAAVLATANVAPGWALEIYNAFTAGDWRRCQLAQSHIALLRRALGLATFPAIIKEAMSMIGMNMGPARPPVGTVTPENKMQLRKVLQTMELL